MPLIKLETVIRADAQTCFDVSRNIDAHSQSMAGSKEGAIGGRTNGLIGLNETVTWRAKHLGFWWHLTSIITEMSPPHSFTDEMIRGPFKRMHHRHTFVDRSGQTVMTDEFEYASPLGLLGKFADWLVIERYMRKLLGKRNEWIKRYAEGRER